MLEMVNLLEAREVKPAKTTLASAAASHEFKGMASNAKRERNPVNSLGRPEVGNQTQPTISTI